MRNSIRQHFSGMSLRTKLIASYLLLILLPMLSLGLFSYKSIIDVMTLNTAKAYLESIRQVNINIQHRLEINLNSAIIVWRNEDLIQILRLMNIRNLNPGEEITTYWKLNDIKNTLNTSNGATATWFALKGNSKFILPNTDIFNLDGLYDDPTIAKWLSDATFYNWFPAKSITTLKTSKANNMLLFVKINDPDYLKRLLGLIIIEVDYQYLLKPLQGMELPQDAWTFVSDQQNIIQGYHLPIKVQNINSSMKETISEVSPGISRFVADNKIFYMVEVENQILGWKLGLVLREEHLLGDSDQFRMIIFLATLILSFIATLLAVWITHSIGKRLTVLMNLIVQIEQGNFGVTIPSNYQDEYGKLQQAINTMSLKIETLIKDVYSAQEEQKQTEMRLLYAQMNPHFLYNTLDIIKWGTLRIKADHLSHICDALSTYLRLSLNSGRELISIASEVLEVENYMKIINYRYQENITFQTSVDPSVADQKIIKMILQPLVENSVMHGILCTESKRGTITVTAFQEEGAILITVKDDGAGMSEDAIKTVLLEDGKGYGVKNVNTRIQKYYGSNSGLTFVSTVGVGCTVIVRLEIEKSERD